MTVTQTAATKSTSAALNAASVGASSIGSLLGAGGLTGLMYLWNKPDDNKDYLTHFINIGVGLGLTMAFFPSAAGIGTAAKFAVRHLAQGPLGPFFNLAMGHESGGNPDVAWGRFTPETIPLINGKRISQSTIRQVLQWQSSASPVVNGVKGTNAAGAIQFMPGALEASVLWGQAHGYPISFDSIFDLPTQLDVGVYNLLRLGFGDFLNGKKSLDWAMGIASGQWAPLPNASGRAELGGIGVNPLKPAAPADLVRQALLYAQKQYQESPAGQLVSLADMATATPIIQ